MIAFGYHEECDTIMIYCTTSLKLLGDFSVETRNLNALDAAVKERECAIFPSYRDANVTSESKRTVQKTALLSSF